MSTTKDHRLFKVRELVEKSGGVTSFATRLGLSKQYVSQIASKKATNRKPIGDATARKIEKEFSFPVGYLDSPPEQSLQAIGKYSVRMTMLEAAGSNRNFELATYKEDVIYEQDVNQFWLKANFVLSDDGNFSIATVRTDRMKPTFTKGDVVWIDRNVNRVDDAGIYVIQRGKWLLVNRVQPVDGGIKLLNDNNNYESELVLDSEIGELVVYGKVLASWHLEKH